jgi:hypothetical protein
MYSSMCIDGIALHSEAREDIMTLSFMAQFAVMYMHTCCFFCFSSSIWKGGGGPKDKKIMDEDRKENNHA